MDIGTYLQANASFDSKHWIVIPSHHTCVGQPPLYSAWPSSTKHIRHRSAGCQIVVLGGFGPELTGVRPLSQSAVRNAMPRVRPETAHPALEITRVEDWAM